MLYVLLLYCHANATTTLQQYQITKPVCVTWYRLENNKIFFLLFLFNKIKVRFTLRKIIFYSLVRYLKSVFLLKNNLLNNISSR